MKKMSLTKHIVAIIVLLFVASSIIITSLSIKDTLIDDYEVSTNLELVTNIEDGIEICSYVDSKGNITFAGDKKYAYLERKRDDENRVIEERYFDEDGNPSKLAGGYYAVAFSYDGSSRTTTYLDENLKNVTTVSGTEIVVRTYPDEDSKDFIDLYYDFSMNPKANSVDCYGIKYLYDGDLNTEYMWVDSDGNPMNCKSGYSIVKRMFDDKNRVIQEMFYDSSDTPCTNSYGEYGNSITYDSNNRREIVTSLDINSNPIMNKNGYSSVVYTYNKYNGLDTELFYDLDGNPCTTGKGWYGKKHDGDRIYYLNKNGNIMLSVDSILANLPFMVTVFGLLVCLVFVLAPHKIRIGVIILYFMFIMYETILYRVSHAPTANLEIFWSYKQFFTDEGLRIEILNNMWLFVPYSLGIVSVLKNKKIVIGLLLLPLLIEIVQFVFGIGLSEFDDLISNGFGELIGIGIWYITKDIKFGKLKRKLIGNK